MATIEEEVRSPPDKDIEILKWKVRKGSKVFKGSVLALYVESGSEDKSQSTKLKAHESGIVSQIKVLEGTVVCPGELLAVIQPQTDDTCTHPTIMKDMCADCGADLRREMGTAGDRKKSVSASVAMVHSIPELIVSQEQALELGKEDENRLLRERKLVLLVDLDQTLIHTTNDNIPPNLKDVKHFQLWHGKSHMWYHTKFRPFTQQFLKAVSKMYELHICTFGVRMYAHIIARLLDPEEKYFSHRILSRDECFDALSKTANLKALFPCGDKMVGIIDDREDVWNHAPNLIHVKPYRFFQGTADINAPPELTKSEHDNEPITHRLVDHSRDKKVPQPDKVYLNSEAAKIHESVSADPQVTVKSLDTPDNLKTLDAEKTSGQNEKEEKENQISSVAEESDAKSVTGGVEVQDVSDDSKLDDLEEEPSSLNQECSENSSGSCGDATADNASVRSVPDPELAGSGCINDPCKGEDRRDSDIAMDTSDVDVTSNGKCDGNVSQEDQKKDQGEIEWDDDDDYLLHLEEILTRIHKAYYGMYEQFQSTDSKELPDLKTIIPYVRKKTLKGCNIVFSGMFPLNVPLEKSRAYITARALGANVHNDIVQRKTKNGTDSEVTTHLVAAKPGTGKHKSALKARGIHIVSGDWLWACNERWEWVDESLYPLISKDESSKNTGSPGESTPRRGKSSSTKRKNEEHQGKDCAVEGSEAKINLETAQESKKQKLETHEFDKNSETQATTSDNSIVKIPQDNFANSFNPLYSFSDEDIEFMDKEVDEIMDEDDGSSDESDEEREARIRQKVLREVEESDSDSDSLSGDFPRGWKMRRKSFSPNMNNICDEQEKETNAEDQDEETENELERYQKNMAAFAPDESEADSNEDEESIGSVDDEIADAVEKEFLNSL